MSNTTGTDNRWTPTLWCRACVYALAWLLPLIAVNWYLPKFALILAKHDEKGQLPELTHKALALVRLNQTCYSLPTAVAFVVAFLIAETLLCGRRRAGRNHSGGWAWFVVVALLGSLAWGIPLAVLLGRPVYVFPATSI